MSDNERITIEIPTAMALNLKDIAPRREIADMGDDVLSERDTRWLAEYAATLLDLAENAVIEHYGDEPLDTT